MADAKAGEFFLPKKEKEEDKDKPEAKQEDKQEGSNQQPRRRRSGDIGELLVGYAPGLQPLDLTDEAKLIKAGSDIILQLHYTANGTPGTDKTTIGLIYAKQPSKVRNVMLAASNAGFKIPPNDGNYEVKSQVELPETVTLSDLMPHMHFRGKDFRFEVIYPDGKTETLLSVPKYDFNWQLGYRLAQPLVLPKGTRIECTAPFDNSAHHPYNPDPTKAVKWGDQTWGEMMIGWFSVSVADPTVTAAPLIKFEKPGKRTSTQPGAKPANAAGSVGGGSQQ